MELGGTWIFWRRLLSLGILLGILLPASVAMAKSVFPKIIFDGYLEGKYSFKRTFPTNANRDVIEKDPVYTALPADLIEGSGKYEHHLKLRIDAKLDEKLSAAYDIEQQPDFPAKYDIQVINDKTKLSFFNYDAAIGGTSYTNVQKALNGVYLQQDGDEWKGQFAFGRQRSDPVKATFTGNGGTTYKIGQSSVLEGSVQVIINDKPVAPSEYDINYYEGTLKFKTPKTSADAIKIIYEFTNPAEDFIPVLSQKNFTLARVEYTNQSAAAVQPIELQVRREMLIAPPPPPSENEEPSEDAWLLRDPTHVSRIDDYMSDDKLFGIQPDTIPPTQTFQLDHYPLVPGSESVLLSNRALKAGVDYVIRYRSGTIVFPKLQIFPEDSLWINYKYYDTVTTTDVIEAKDSQGPYYVKHAPLVRGSEVVDVQDNIYFRD